jgi:peptidoglycan/xylan/chitin deacetylase (PgdA/CDA1 family)
MGVRADFLVSGASCRAHPELVRKIASEHETLGSYAMTDKALDRLPIKDAEDRIEEGRESIETAASIKTTLFGFPLVASSPDLIDYVEQKKMTLLVSKLGMAIGRHYMTVDSRDWQLMDASALYDHVTSNLDHGPFLHPQEGGTIILLHDGYAATGIALPYIIEEILARGLKPVVVVGS